jgi:hypothetical protein
MTYFSGQGKVYVAERETDGSAKAFRFIGNVPALSVSLSLDKLEHKESTTGQRLKDLEIVREKNAEFQATVEEWNIENLSMAFYGVKAAVTGSSILNEETPSGIVAGDFVRTRYADISSVVITDSAGSPATLTLGTHYRINSAKHGSIEFLNVTGFTQPFEIDYTYAAQSNLPLFTESGKDFWVRFEGLNTADSDREVLVELYKVRIDPTTEFPMINDELLQFELGGAVLDDDTKDADALLGRFGRIVLLT